MSKPMGCVGHYASGSKRVAGIHGTFRTKGRCVISERDPVSANDSIIHLGAFR